MQHWCIRPYRSKILRCISSKEGEEEAVLCLHSRVICFHQRWRTRLCWKTNSQSLWLTVKLSGEGKQCGLQFVHKLSSSVMLMYLSSSVVSKLLRKRANSLGICAIKHVNMGYYGWCHYPITAQMCCIWMTTSSALDGWGWQHHLRLQLQMWLSVDLLYDYD